MEPLFFLKFKLLVSINKDGGRIYSMSVTRCSAVNTSFDDVRLRPYHEIKWWYRIIVERGFIFAEQVSSNADIDD